MLCRKKNDVTYEATRWYKHGDHPKVKASPLLRYGTLLTGTETKRVNRGDWIVRVKSGEFLVYSDFDFNKHYELIITDE